MKSYLVGVACFLSVSMSFTVSAQTDTTVFDGNSYVRLNMSELVSTIQTLQNQIDALEFVCGSSYSYDGHDYATVLIGGQCWFAENLRSENYADGSVIPAGLDDTAWSTTTAGAVTVYGDGTSNVNNNNSNNDEVANLANYGRLYNWYAVDDASGLCPSGWHVPTDSEYMTLEMELGMSSTDADILAQWRGTNEGEKLKSSSGDAPPWSGTNTSGFSGLPGGNRVQPGDFMWGGNNGYFWTASPRGTNAWYRKFEGGRDNIYRNYTVKGAGLTVRCVWD